jgi:hypothetical protein
MFYINDGMILQMLISYKSGLEKMIRDGLATDKDRIQYYRVKKSINEVRRERKHDSKR